MFCQYINKLQAAAFDYSGIQQSSLLNPVPHAQDLEEINRLRRLAKGRFTAIIIALILGIMAGVFGPGPGLSTAMGLWRSDGLVCQVEFLL